MTVIISLDTGWMFGPASGGRAPTPVTLPHTVTPLSWQNWKPARWERTWRYSTTFDAPAASGGMRAFLDFAGAMTRSTVTLNNATVADFLGGYLPFSGEITRHLRPSGNQLSVLLDATFNLNVPPDRPAPSASKDVDFWQPGGIYRGVRLRVVPPAFIADVFARPVKASDGPVKASDAASDWASDWASDGASDGASDRASDWSVDVQVTVDAGVAPTEAATVRVELLDGTRVLGSGTAGVTVPGAGGQVTVGTTLTRLGDITVWDCRDTSPKLYTVVATLLVGSTPVDHHQVRTGFRTISFQEDGFYLNGRRVTLLGLNRHQFYPFAGGAMPARVQAKDARILREELNCTMVRCSHYPQSEDFLDACDELGLMVWDEVPGWGYIGDPAWRELACRDVRTMIVRDRNHPSVVLWGVRLNETNDDKAFYERTNEIARGLDSSRPTAGAMSSWRPAPGNYQQDVYCFDDYSHGFDGPDLNRRGVKSRDVKSRGVKSRGVKSRGVKSRGVKSRGVKRPTLQPPVAGKPYMVSEAIGTLSGPARFYRRTDSQEVQQGQAMAHATVHDIAASDDRYCGLLAWSGFDYLSGSGRNRYRGVKYTGVADLFRIPKPGAAIYQAQVSPAVAAVIAPAFYWDFGKTSPVSPLTAAMICSNLDYLKVYVGGELLTTVEPDRAGYRHLAYPPSFVDFSAVNGSTLPGLRVDGYLGSALAASRLFCADHAGDFLSLKADDDTIAGDGVDATRVVLRAVDRHGAPRPYVTGKVTFAITGPHVLLGDNPFDFKRAGGAGAVWIRSQPGSRGTVTVKASHRALGHAEVAITVASALPA